MSGDVIMVIIGNVMALNNSSVSWNGQYLILKGIQEYLVVSDQGNQGHKVEVKYDMCHEKIDLFGVQNIVIHELLWWMCLQAHKPGKYFSGWLSNLWLFWNKIYCNSSSRTNFTQIWRPKNCQHNEPQRGLFSRDTRHIWTSFAMLVKKAYSEENMCIAQNIMHGSRWEIYSTVFLFTCMLLIG